MKKEISEKMSFVALKRLWKSYFNVKKFSEKILIFKVLLLISLSFILLVLSFGISEDTSGCGSDSLNSERGGEFDTNSEGFDKASKPGFQPCNFLGRFEFTQAVIDEVSKVLLMDKFPFAQIVTLSSSTDGSATQLSI